jgi:hypothetical protein
LLNDAEKIRFGENHRRAISALMRGTERACEEVLQWLDHRPTALVDVRNDLSPDQDNRLRGLVAALRAEVLGFSEKAHLDSKKSSVRRSVAAIVSTALVDLQEVEDSGLKGYGLLADRERRILDEHIPRMTTLLGQMLHIVENE